MKMNKKKFLFMEISISVLTYGFDTPNDFNFHTYCNKYQPIHVLVIQTSGKNVDCISTACLFD